MRSSASRSGARRRLALFLLCLASFMAVVNDTIVTIALSSIRRDLGFSGADVQWIFNGYMLAFGGLLILSGRAADLWGRRRMFVGGLALFGVASLFGGLAPSPGTLICARVLQGLGAAAFVPASLSLLTATFAEGEQRNRAIGVYGAMASLGFVVGMVGGGWITEFLGWRWVFFVNVPVALAALLAAPAAVTESRDEGAPRALDLSGAVTATLGLTSLIYAVSEIPDSGWVSPATLGFGGLGALLLALFILAERRSPAPLVPLEAFRERALVGPNAGIFLQSMVGLPWLYVLTLYLQDALGHTPLQAGLLFLPMTLTGVVAAPLAGRLVTRLGARATAASGLALSAVGLLLTASMSSGGGFTLVLSGMVVGEAGFIICNTALTIAGSGGAGEDRKGLSAGLL
ncbi:MAG TPA: MFS transporter, partial [Rubrobacteraceae bacterium]|nr:MFS transporter [Rubrobacteraceae bacterium]